MNQLIQSIKYIHIIIEMILLTRRIMQEQLRPQTSRLRVIRLEVLEDLQGR